MITDADQLAPIDQTPRTTDITEAKLGFRSNHAAHRHGEGRWLNVCIVGSRGFSSSEVLRSSMATLRLKALKASSYFHPELKRPLRPVYLCGGAKGADTLGREYAKSNGFSTITFQPDWAAYPKTAGFIRNVQMATLADMLIAFWDGKSSGTRHMLRTCRAINQRCAYWPMPMYLFDLSGKLTWKHEPPRHPNHQHAKAVRKSACVECQQAKPCSSACDLAERRAA